MQPTLDFLVSSPYGDIRVLENQLDLPLEQDPLKTPYRVYFNNIVKFLSCNKYTPFLKAVSKKISYELSLNDILNIIIRAEKHGLLYHPASIELITPNQRFKFALNVAISEMGKKYLRKETQLLLQLQSKYSLSYLPYVYHSGEIDSMVFLLEDWFDGYHEFHHTKDNMGNYKLNLWEFGKGYRYITEEVGFEIFTQAAKILTLYFDVQEFNFIYPWHHAAGDFIVKIEDEKVDVRLITVRDYKPLLNFHRFDTNPLMALFFFLLHLSVQMRLDKLDGIGEVVWAEDYCIDATLKGFFEGLSKNEKTKNYITDLKSLLKSFSSDELCFLFNPFIDYYNGLKDLPVIIKNLEAHMLMLHKAIQDLP
jgi:hypothetical protein